MEEEGLSGIIIISILIYFVISFGFGNKESAEQQIVNLAKENEAIITLNRNEDISNYFKENFNRIYSYMVTDEGVTIVDNSVLEDKLLYKAINMKFHENKPLFETIKENIIKGKLINIEIKAVTKKNAFGNDYSELEIEPFYGSEDKEAAKKIAKENQENIDFKITSYSEEIESEMKLKEQIIQFITKLLRKGE